MSDPKRATLITVGATKNVKNNVNKTVRLTINLDESNESKYPELNYKELVIATARKKKTVNGKTQGLDPFSDNDDDVERVARKFEQKYGGKSTYGRKGRSKFDEFADIGAGYDENDSFIDNTDGYDEMMPPECDTAYGGFYINCGSLEFKLVPENQAAAADGESDRRNKRSRCSSSSDDASSGSSSDSDSRDAKEAKVTTNGGVDSHKTEHRKKKNKNIENPKKIRRTDSSAATSGKQTSDDNAHGDAESGDSRTSQSDSLTSKPALSSENPITSDSSRDTEVKADTKLPTPVNQLLEELEAKSNQLQAYPKEADVIIDQYAVRLERTLNKVGADKAVRRVAWGRASRTLHVPRARLLQRSRAADLVSLPVSTTSQSTTASITSTASMTVTASTTTTSTSTGSTTKPSTGTTVAVKRKADDSLSDLDIENMTADEKEAKIVETLKKLKELIEERKPAMMAAYNAECERVQEVKIKLQIAQSTEGGPHVDKRLPKRRFPWCVRSRSLLARLARLCSTPAAAAALLQARALPLFPNGFVRMPTLLRQADLSKDIKASDVKSQRGPQISHSTSNPQPFAEPIQFPSTLTVTTTLKHADKGKIDDKEHKNDVVNNAFGSIMNTFSLHKELIIEKPNEKKKETSDRGKEDYIPHNNIGSITITPVPSSQKIEKKINMTNDKSKEPLLRVKSPAALNDMVNKKDKHKKDKNYTIMKEKRLDAPLHIDTGHQSKKETAQSPKNREEISQKLIENMRIQENNIPKPMLVAVSHSPTFAKPDKRPPEVRKKKDVLIVSDLDPLAEVISESVAVDDSSSDVEFIEDKLDKSDIKSDGRSDKVPLKDKVSDSMSHKKVSSVKNSKSVSSNDMQCRQEPLVQTPKEDGETLVRNWREIEQSQEASKLNCNTFGGVISNAKVQSSKFNQPIYKARSDKDKLAERVSLNKMDGCSVVTG